MTLIVEDGGGGIDSDAYIDEADCAAYLDKYAPEGDQNPFTLADEGDQEIAIRNATRFIDANYALRFTGVKGTQDQALQWPRSGATDNDGRTFAYNEMPKVLLDATCELALQMRRDQDSGFVENPPLMPTQDTPGVLTRKRVKADVVESEKEWDAEAGGASEQAYYALADRMLAPILQSGNRVALG